MKKIKSKIFIAILLLPLMFSSCAKSYLEDVNTDNNEPAEVNPEALLPAAQGSLFYSVGGDCSRYTSIFTQQVTGVARQFFSYNRYIMTEEEFNNYWNNMYAGNMHDCNRIMNYASQYTDGRYNQYDAAARVLMAYALMNMTDMFGDVPYTEAFQDINNLKPAYDTQTDVYITIQGLLDEAIVKIDGYDPDVDPDYFPGSNDFMFGGDMTKWKALANGLKARAYIHLTKLPSNSIAASTNAIAAINAGGLSDNSGDMQFIFGSAYQSPWFQYIDQRDDIGYFGSCLDLMQAKNDPRYGIYVDVNGDYYYEGALGPFFMAEEAPVTLFSYEEQKFIEAEANFRLGNDVDAEAALVEAISSHMSKLGVSSDDAATYLANNVDWATNSDKLGLIMNEKYTALFLNPEAWTDWRRTGYPALTVNDGVLPQIPRRFIYPTNERQYNPNDANQGSTLLQPTLWWDN
jgi:Starch-binding associating with outer membrane